MFMFEKRNIGKKSSFFKKQKSLFKCNKHLLNKENVFIHLCPSVFSYEKFIKKIKDLI